MRAAAHRCTFFGRRPVVTDDDSIAFYHPVVERMLNTQPRARDTECGARPLRFRIQRKWNG